MNSEKRLTKAVLFNYKMSEVQNYPLDLSANIKRETVAVQPHTDGIDGIQLGGIEPQPLRANEVIIHEMELGDPIYAVLSVPVIIQSIQTVQNEEEIRLVDEARAVIIGGKTFNSCSCCCG